MPLRNPIILFFCRFVLLYVLLVLPWPVWDGIYGAYFRTLGRAVFVSDRGDRDLSFETTGEEPHPLYTRIFIANRRTILADGTAITTKLDLDAQSFGWKPTAMLMALIIATPIPWRRRALSLLWGLLATHVLVLIFLGFCIWNQSTEVSLVTLSEFWKHFTNGLRDLLITQYNLAVPVFVWILVTLRSQDRRSPIGLAIFGPVPGNAQPQPAGSRGK